MTRIRNPSLDVVQEAALTAQWTRVVQSNYIGGYGNCFGAQLVLSRELPIGALRILIHAQRGALHVLEGVRDLFGKVGGTHMELSSENANHWSVASARTGCDFESSKAISCCNSSTPTWMGIDGQDLQALGFGKRENFPKLRPDIERAPVGVAKYPQQRSLRRAAPKVAVENALVLRREKFESENDSALRCDRGGCDAEIPELRWSVRMIVANINEVGA